MAGRTEGRRPPADAEAPARAIALARRRGLLPEGARVLVALSGGRDSASLLHAMARLDAWTLSSATVDHRLHPASAAHAAAAAEGASALGVPSRVLVAEGDAPSTAGQGPEAAARRARYRLLHQHAAEVGAIYIVTAHTADDQAETLLMRLGEGTGLRGFAGIPAQRGAIVRPWLSVGRGDVAAYAARHGVPHVEDPTNSDARFLRNAIRRDVLPSMEACFDADWTKRAARSAQNARGALLLLDLLLEQRPDLVRRSAAGVEVPRDALRALPRDARRTLVDRALSLASNGGRRRRLHVDRILELEPGQVCSLPAGRSARATRSSLIIEEAPQPGGPPEPVRIDGPGAFTWGRWSLEIRPGRRVDDPRAVALPVHGAPFPWLVRGARPGDRMRPRGAPGSKTLRRLWADRQVPPRLRGILPVLECEGRPIWASGLRAAEHVRVEPDEPAWLLEVVDGVGASAGLRRHTR